MALINKLRAIGDGFRESRGTTQEYTLEEMAALAAEPLGSGGAVEDLEDILLEQETKINDLLSLLEQKSVGNIKYREKLIEAYERTSTELDVEEVKLISQYMFTLFLIRNES